MTVPRVLASFLISLSASTWAADRTPCAAPILNVPSLTALACGTHGELVIERYSGQKPVSPYATEFDQRTVATARSSHAASVADAAGIRGGALQQTQLVQPPQAEQITRRQRVQTRRLHGHWIVYTEHIWYNTPGGAPGYVFDCATALRRHGAETVAVAECFPVEERSRFMSTLDSVR